MPRKNVKLDAETHARLLEHKGDGETWDRFLFRLVKRWEELDRRGGQAGVPHCLACGELAGAWTLVDGSVRCLDCADVDVDAAEPEGS